MSKPIHILSLGAGVQSSTLALASSRDEAEKAKGELKATREYAETSDEQSDLRLQTILDLERKLATLAAECESLRADKERLDWLDGISVSAVEPEPFRWNIHWGHNEANIRDGVDAARADAARKEQP